MKRFFRAAFMAVLVLVVVGVGAASLALGRIVKVAVESAGPRLLGASIALGAVAISPFSGRGTVRGLTVGNPSGFKGEYALKAGSVEVEVRLASLMTGTVVVESVSVRDPEIAWELGADGVSNLTRLQKNAEAAAARLGGAPAPSSKPGVKGKSLLVRRLEVTGGKVRLSAAIFGGGSLTTSLPDVHMTDLGGPGRSPAQVAAQTLGAVTGSAQHAVAGIGASTAKAGAAAMSALGSLFHRGGK
jgi:uncharacterized protein involved in outer membrane biogenesis